MNPDCLFLTGYPYVGLTVNKTDSVSIFSVSDAAKERIDTMLSTSDFA